MNNQRRSPNRSSRGDVYERLSQQLEAMAEREGRYSNAEKIALLRKVMFEDEDALEQSGTVIIPK